jgi:ring-1,2-phenylacetyl-CoA epoxidase subunit PaaC
VDKLPDRFEQPFVELLLSVADDKFILGHRNADWTGLAPILEEDIAFSSLSQDEIAHATALYQMIAGFLGTKPDKLAFGRKPEEYRCAQLVELSDEYNWAMAICRNFFCDHFDSLRLRRLAQSKYTPLAQLAARLAAEEQIHIEHVDSWMKRLGQGGEDASRRMQEELDRLTPLASLLFEPAKGQEDLEAEGIYPHLESEMFGCWAESLQNVARESGLSLRLRPVPPGVVGGRRGRHSDTFLVLLDELTEVYRLEPEAAW